MTDDQVKYELLQATTTDFGFIRAVKYSGLRPYVEEVWGWDQDYQGRRFLTDFRPDQYQIIHFEEEGGGVLQVEVREETAG